MNAVENQVRQLVDVELAAANERFPQFHSAHEAWAVLREEAEELREEDLAIYTNLNYIWGFGVRKNGKNPLESLEKICDHAINAACEAIQVAAMCKKFLEMEGAVD